MTMFEILVPTLQDRFELRDDRAQALPIRAFGDRAHSVFQFLFALLAWPFIATLEVVSQKIKAPFLCRVHHPRFLRIPFQSVLSLRTPRRPLRAAHERGGKNRPEGPPSPGRARPLVGRGGRNRYSPTPAKPPRPGARPPPAPSRRAYSSPPDAGRRRVSPARARRRSSSPPARATPRAGWCRSSFSNPRPLRTCIPNREVVRRAAARPDNRALGEIRSCALRIPLQRSVPARCAARFAPRGRAPSGYPADGLLDCPAWVSRLASPLAGRNFRRAVGRRVCSSSRPGLVRSAQSSDGPRLPRLCWRGLPPTPPSGSAAHRPYQSSCAICRP